jgi:hypothetical protein
MINTPPPDEKDSAFRAFRADLDRAVVQGMEEHEAKMTKLGFVFLGVFVAVIVVAALLP